MKTDYAGIDYGLGQANVDKATGIRYGMIGQHSVSPEAMDDVFSNGKDLGFESAEQELKDKLRHALSDYFSGTKWDDKPSRLDNAVESAFDAVDGWADNIESSGPMLYESDSIIVQTTENNELWVFKSPYYTLAQFCSPCVPGAGNLDSPCDSGIKTYCLGHTWFEDSKAPYPIYSVETGELINP